MGISIDNLPTYQPTNPKTFLVVGAGVGGLATALRLAHSGHRVTVFEKTDQVGGRNRSRRVGDCEFDAGPTLVMMLEPLRRLFEDVGERLEDHLALVACDPIYRVFFADGARVDATADRCHMARAVQQLGGDDASDAFGRMLDDLEALYSAAIPMFVERNFYGPLDFFGPSSLRAVARHRMLDRFARRVSRYFADPRLRMLFSFQAMYLGLSPFQAPWVYATLTYMEYGAGIWYPRGGVAEISRVLARLAEVRGAEIRCDTPVRQIDGRAVVLGSGERIEADAVICNADLPYAEKALLGEEPRWRRASCSAYMLYMDYDGSLPALEHHNVFFGGDFRRNLEDIFARGRLPDDPAFYACVSARHDPGKALPGHENLMVLVPCPNLDRPWHDRDARCLRERVFDRLKRECGFDASRIAAVSDFSPADWAQELNLDRGAAFGLSHELRQSAYFRPANRSKRHPGVYFVGASTIPGNGLPMVLISAELLEERLLHDGVL